MGMIMRIISLGYTLHTYDMLIHSSDFIFFPGFEISSQGY